ncbi:Sodium-coupled neutral amino acid transporter 9-like [Exaiptasia diaphana]|nr:Sodium-coupled neutral amino acid transporter 9-like [Exaiptasia diaphana]
MTVAGFGFGLGLMLVIAAICLYTAYLILKSSQPFVKHGEMVEFGDICKHHFGRAGEFVATSFSITAIGGAAIVFWVLMSTFLYNSGRFIHESSLGAFPNNQSSTEVLCPLHEHANTSDVIPNSLVHADKSSFYKIWKKRETIPFFLILLMLPLCSIKSPTFFTKFNSLGTIAVIYIVIFVSVKASIWGINMDFSSATRIPEFKIQFPALTGTLTLAYFIHNCVLSIMRNQKNPKNNSRDLSIAYLLVAFTYIFVGSMFYAAFPIEKSCISQVFLDNMPASDGMAFGARIGLFFQLVTVFPLIVYIVRVQFMLYVFGKSYPGQLIRTFDTSILKVNCLTFSSGLKPDV